MTKLPFEFRGFAKSKKFKRDYKKLDPDVLDRVDEAIKELATGDIPPGRKLKKRKPKKRGIYQIFVSNNYRLTFMLDEDDSLLLLRVGTHRAIEITDC